MNALSSFTAESDPRWAAIRARDPSADDAFVYSVATTRVYCRPSCPSRAANPRNVRFHADAAAAERAGFRACLRCKPDGPSPREARAALVAAACRRLAEAEEPLTLSDLARESGLSPHHFQRLFTAVVGLSPAAYGRAARAERVRAALDADAPVTTALYDAGFNSSGRFYAAADAILGMTPTARRRRGEGERIVFGVGESRLGAVLAAESARGVCAVFLGDDPDALVRDLQARFPKAEIAPGGEAFEARMAQVVGVVQGDLPAQELPLDVRAPPSSSGCGGRCANSAGRDGDLRRDRGQDRSAQGGAGGGERMRRQPGRRGHPLPPYRAAGRRPLRLPLGRRAQARAARPRTRPQRRPSQRLSRLAACPAGGSSSSDPADATCASSAAALSRHSWAWWSRRVRSRS